LVLAFIYLSINPSTRRYLLCHNKPCL